MKTLFSLGLAVVGLANFAAPLANAHETIPVQTRSAGTLPNVVHINETVVVERSSRHYHPRRYRTVRRVIFRHGHRVVIYRKIYY